MSETESANMTWARVDEACAALHAQVGRIEVAVILGSGLGAFADQLATPTRVAYEHIPHFARSTVAGHAGAVVAGRIDTRRVAIFAGRFHHYEGWTADQIVLPVRVAAGLGARVLIVTNAAGSLDPALPPGTLMLIADHINNLGFNPLRGENDARRGERFPSLNAAYPRWLRDHAHAAAARRGIELAEGVYMANPGPTYESPAEIRMMRLLGADAVGMSTVPEVIAAVHLGVPVLGISCITNFGAGLVETAPSHEEVIATGQVAAARFVGLLREVIASLPAERLQ